MLRVVSARLFLVTGLFLGTVATAPTWACALCGSASHATVGYGGDLIQSDPSSLVPSAATAHTAGVPELASRPGAAYTIYMNFAGFNFTGNWGNVATQTPGNLPSYGNVSATGSFSSPQQANIRNIWARTVEKYSGMNVNVTTIDPAVAANRTASDADRQAYYDQTSRLMHTVIAGADSANTFISGGGISYVGVTQSFYGTTTNSGAGAGFHTNFSFSSKVGGEGALRNIAEVSAHENGHGLRLNHQSDYTSGAKVNEYSSNGGNANVAPIMGNSYGSARGTYRIGTSSSSSPTNQNDVQLLMGNSSMGGFINDGIGHTLLTATPLPMNPLTGVISPTAADGWIMPASTTSPQAIGESNYTSDYFSFFTTGGLLNLTLNEGGQLLTPGVLDPGGTLDAVFRLLDSTGNELAEITNPSTQTNLLSRTLNAGTYHLQIASAGGKTSARDDGVVYFDMGSYFLTGTVAVPEPGICVITISGIGLLLRRRRAA